MVKIDGEKVRSFREVKGLTQLYLASAVEVTTDTISRWENKRYPQIKKENAIRLAEALDVSLEDILDQHESQIFHAPHPDLEPVEKVQENTLGQIESPASPSIAVPFASARRVGLIIGLVVIVSVLCVSFWLNFSSNNVEISALRMAPAHVVPGQPFPVVLKIDTGAEAASFILKEIIPPQCILLNGGTPGSVVDQKNGEIKWITKAKSPKVKVGYMLQTRDDHTKIDLIIYSGSITQRKAKGDGKATGGREATAVSTYHWADTDKNGLIDDEEILAVYDDFDDIDGLTLDMDQIEDIWFGTGYEWDSAKRKFVVIY